MRGAEIGERDRVIAVRQLEDQRGCRLVRPIASTLDARGVGARAGTVSRQLSRW